MPPPASHPTPDFPSSAALRARDLSRDLSRALPNSCSESRTAPAADAGTEPRAKAATRTTRRAADWRALFHAHDSREVLARLMHDDPLGLRARVAARLAERAYLLDVDRALLRSFARTARAALGYRGDPELDAWLDERIDEAVADLLSEDHEAERSGAALDDRQATVFSTLGRPLGLAPAELRAACVQFNRLPPADRRAFQALVIQGRTLDELAHERRESASDAARAARRGLEALLHGANARQVPTPPSRP
ncbi:MAG: hypothetical protein HZA52_10725 [Planctomycetes bacterium]|nr:hypothetical protein [Planctomycetota bacterium]